MWRLGFVGRDWGSGFWDTPANFLSVVKSFVASISHHPLYVHQVRSLIQNMYA